MDEGRRTALAAILGAALPSARAARQGDKVRVVGYISRGADADVLSRAMTGLGWVPGDNLRFELRKWGSPDSRELERLAQDLVRARVDALLGFSPQVVTALAATTRTIPIVCGGHPDPVGAGLASELRRPGGNVTGLSNDAAGNIRLYLRLCRVMLPKLRRLVALGTREEPGRLLSGAAAEAGVSVEAVKATTTAAFEDGFASIRDREHEAAFVEEPTSTPGAADVLAAIRQDNRKVADIAIRRRIVTFAASNTNQVRDGLLMYHAQVHGDRMAKAARMLDKILRGTRPAEIPFELPDHTAFWVNRATAQAIGVEIPTEILIRATTIVD